MSSPRPLIVIPGCFVVLAGIVGGAVFGLLGAVMYGDYLASTATGGIAGALAGAVSAAFWLRRMVRLRDNQPTDVCVGRGISLGLLLGLLSGLLVHVTLYVTTTIWPPGRGEVESIFFAAPLTPLT